MPAQLLQGERLHNSMNASLSLSMQRAVKGSWFGLQAPHTRCHSQHVWCACARPPSTAAEAKAHLCPGQEQELALVCEERIEDGEPEGDAAASCKAQVGRLGVLMHAAACCACRTVGTCRKLLPIQVSGHASTYSIPSRDLQRPACRKYWSPQQASPCCMGLIILASIVAPGMQQRPYVHVSHAADSVSCRTCRTV
jgi:hypothetical protein